MATLDILALLLIGLLAGGAGGLLGVGGSIVMIPAMTEVLGPDQHLYQAAAMIVNFFVVVPAVVQHRRARAIELSTVRRLMPMALVAVLLGVGVSELSFFSGEGEARLRGLFGVFLLLMAGYDLYRLFRREGSTIDRGSIGGGGLSWARAAAVAVPTGLVAGLLGVGGGLLAVPLQRRILRIPIRTAIANSATIIIATSLFGAAAKNYAFVTGHGHTLQSFLLAAVLTPTAIVGALFGSRLTHRLPLKWVKALFFALLIIAGLRLTWSLWG